MVQPFLAVAEQDRMIVEIALADLGDGGNGQVQFCDEGPVVVTSGGRDGHSNMAAGSAFSDIRPSTPTRSLDVSIGVYSWFYPFKQSRRGTDSVASPGSSKPAMMHKQ
jgi:hypothetical protein